MILNLGSFQDLVDRRMIEWERTGFFQRFWEKDSRLWSQYPAPEYTNRMGWLDLPISEQSRIEEYREFAQTILDRGIRRVILLGMGGSSLAPEMFARIFRSQKGYPELVVLDSIHPRAVESLERNLIWDQILFLVSSKSGTTAETLSLCRYFLGKVKRRGLIPCDYFAVVTDADSPLEKLAREEGFGRVFNAPPDVGGRFSALSSFGLVPAALIGMDLSRLLASAVEAGIRHQAGQTGGNFPEGFVLGAVLGEIGAFRNKLLISSPPALSGFPAWLEQLIAESLGKDGKGLIPVPVSHDDLPYPRRRDHMILDLFGPDEISSREPFDTSVSSNSDIPVVVRGISDSYDLGGEIFIWETAVASAGAVLGVNPFDQPDVELSKSLTREILRNSSSSVLNTKNESESKPESYPGFLRKLADMLISSNQEDYISVLVFLPDFHELDLKLSEFSSILTQITGLPALINYGPRYLHSCGQLHKGGPNQGIFILLDDSIDGFKNSESLPDFAALIHAQARGDFLALTKRSRRIVRFSVGEDPTSALNRLIIDLKKSEPLKKSARNRETIRKPPQSEKGAKEGN